MIEERAIVVAVDDNILTVECETKSACSGCASKSNCSSGVVSAAFGEHSQTLSLDNPQQLHVSPGTQVVIGIPEQSLIQGAFLVYLLPLLLFVIGALCIDQLVNANESITILGALVCGTFGYITSRRLLSRSNKTLTPVLLRIENAPAK